MQRHRKNKQQKRNTRDDQMSGIGNDYSFEFALKWSKRFFLIFLGAILMSIFFISYVSLNINQLNQEHDASYKIFLIQEAWSGEPYLMCNKVTRLWDNQWDCETESVIGVSHTLISYSEQTVNQLKDLNKEEINNWCLDNKYEMFCQSSK